MKIVKFADGKFGVRRFVWSLVDLPMFGYEYLAIKPVSNGYLWWWSESSDDYRTDSQLIAIAAMEACIRDEKDRKDRESRLKDRGRPV